MRQQLRSVYRTLRRVIHPSLRYAQSVYEDVLGEHVRAGIDWLDLGCGHQVLPEWRDREEAALVARAGIVVGLDADADSLRRHRTITHRVLGSITTLPFAGETFDLVTANMVIEHLDQPAVQFAEMARVLRPGGHLVLHTPNVFGHVTMGARLLPAQLRVRAAGVLDGREPEDVYPTYYRANSRRALESLARGAGLDVVDITAISSDAAFALVPPLAAIELLWIRALSHRALAGLRSNLIAVLRRPALGAAVDRGRDASAYPSSVSPLASP